jgi:hypothetical protein
MKQPLLHDNDDMDGQEDVSPEVSAQIEHFSRKWADGDDHGGRLHRRGPTRRRIEDWREELELRRTFEDDYDEVG